MANWCALATICLIGSLLGVIILTCLYALTGGRAPFQTGIVLDAGSTHTRLYVYQWDSSKVNGTGRAAEIAIVDGDAKLGLNSMNTSQVYAEVSSLLSKSHSYVPRSDVLTNVYLGATAGMRLLSLKNEDRANLLLCTAGTAIRDSGLKFGASSILSGIDEGLDGWMSVNYYLDRLSNDRPTVGSLDLGGASTQIAFEMQNSTNVTRSLTLYGNEFHVFSKSYPCFGENLAYERYVMNLLIQKDSFKKNDFNIDSPCHCRGFDTSINLSIFLDNLCLNNKHLKASEEQRRIWRSSKVNISGSWNATQCQAMAQTVLNETLCKEDGFHFCFDQLPVTPPLDSEYVAFSAYYYALKETQFNDTKLDKFNETVVHFCDLPYVYWLRKYYRNDPLYASYGCWKIHYVFALITSKFNFNHEAFRHTTFTNEIDGNRIAWTMGYMLNATDVLPAGKPTQPVLHSTLFILLMSFMLVVFSLSIFMFCLHSSADLRRIQGMLAASATPP